MKCKKCGHFGMIKRKRIYLCSWCGNEQADIDTEEKEETDFKNVAEMLKQK